MSAVVDTDSPIWRDNDRSRTCRGMIRKRDLLALVALSGTVAIIIGVSVGRSAGPSDQSSRAVGQAADPSSLGCFNDKRSGRVLGNEFVDEAMTPELCQTHCTKREAGVYALQYGTECWCGTADVELDVYDGLRDPVCDMPCAGDPDSLCGGYLAFSAYEIGTRATKPVSEKAPTKAPSGSCKGSSTYRWASSSNTMYIEGGGCGTLSDIYAAFPDGPVKVLDEDDKVVGGKPTGHWLLTSSLFVYDSSVFQCHGVSDGGDCDVLRIQSDGSKSFHEVRGHGGSLSFLGTKVTSWDTKSGKQQKSYKGGRSFINCVSEVQTKSADCAKNDLGECRMDIINSEMGDLGWFDSESYGLTWKVRGFCPDLSNPEVFDEVNVYGDIQGSDIYGMYYGMYSYGHEGGVWTNNKMHDNILYGFDPHDDSDNLEIADNEVYGNGNHGIIASKRCNNVAIHDNEVYDGGEEAAGIFLHRSSDDAEVYNNYVHDMQDAGIAIMESMNGDVHDNVFENVKYGIRISLGGADNQIYDNVFDTCSQYGLYTYEGSDPPDVSDGKPKNNVFTNNQVLNTKTGTKIKEGVSNEFIGNTFPDTETYEFEDSKDTLWKDNDGTGCLDGDSDFASGSTPPSKC